MIYLLPAGLECALAALELLHLHPEHARVVIASLLDVAQREYEVVSPINHLAASWPCPCGRSATLAQDPGILHNATTGDIDQAAAGCGDAGHGAGDHLDGVRVRREGVYSVVGVGVA